MALEKKKKRRVRRLFLLAAAVATAVSAATLAAVPSEMESDINHSVSALRELSTAKSFTTTDWGIIPILRCKFETMYL